MGGRARRSGTAKSFADPSSRHASPDDTKGCLFEAGVDAEVGMVLDRGIPRTTGAFPCL